MTSGVFTCLLQNYCITFFAGCRCHVFTGCTQKMMISSFSSPERHPQGQRADDPTSTSPLAIVRSNDANFTKWSAYKRNVHRHSCPGDTSAALSAVFHGQRQILSKVRRLVPIRILCYNDGMNVHWKSNIVGAAANGHWDVMP
jgi:hypothetical protein